MPARPLPGAARRVLLTAILAAFALGIYANALPNPIVFDAKPQLETHPDVTGRTGLRDLWLHDAWAGRREPMNQYRPLTILSWHVNARLHGPGDAMASPAVLRLGNVALLILLGCAAAVWMRRYTDSVSAWLAALLLVAHPAHTEAVNLLVGRADLLSLLGIIGFLYMQRRAIEAGRWSAWKAIGATLAATLAVGSKETGLVLVPLAVAQAWLARRESALAQPRPRVALGAAAALGLPLALYLAGRLQTVGLSLGAGPTGEDLTSNPLQNLPLIERLPGALAIAYSYARQIVLPRTAYNLIPTDTPTWADPSVWAGVLVIGCGSALLSWAWRRRPWLVLPLLLALGHYLLVSNLLFPIEVYAANRLTPPFLLAAACAAAAVMHRATAGSVRKQAAVVLPVLPILALMAVVVLRVNPSWSSEAARITADLDAQPMNPVALYRAGIVREGLDDPRRAAPLLTMAVEARPESIQARRALARVLESRDDLPGALEQYRALLTLQPPPRDLDTLVSAADVALSVGEYGLAGQWLHEAAGIDANRAEVMADLAELAEKTGDHESAAARYEAILRLHPEDADARRGLDRVRGTP